MNTLGNIFKVHSFGESHGPFVGAVIDGCPAGLQLNMAAIQGAVDKRKTAQHDFSSARKEADEVQIVAGVYDNITLGTPICILIKNKDARPDDYEHLKDVYRPGHADFTYEQKFGHRDHRGGGRSSIRITAPMVAAGEIAQQLLQQLGRVKCCAFVTQIGKTEMAVSSFIENGLSMEETNFLKTSTHNFIDAAFTAQALAEIEATAEKGDTLGGRISVIVENIPAGLGEPIFGKIQSQLSTAMMSINTVKAISFGDGLAASQSAGSENNDAFYAEDGIIKTKSNHHAGILGGISSGSRLFYSIYFKPISSIRMVQETVNKTAEEETIQISGRHDVCAVPRAVPIVEAYTHIVLADLFLQNRYAKI